MFWLVVNNPWLTLLGWCYSFMFLVLFASPWSMLLLLLLFFIPPWSTLLLFLLFLVKCVWCCCFFYYSLFDATIPFTCSSTFLLHRDVDLLTAPCFLFNTITLAPGPTLVALDWYFPLLIFCKCGKSCPNSIFQARFGR